MEQHYSEILSANITLSELWEDPAPSSAELRARRDTAAVASGFPFVEFLNTPHGVFENTAVRGAGALPCGTQVILSFLANPSAAPDTRCKADMVPLDFRGSRELAEAALGSADLWEN